MGRLLPWNTCCNRPLIIGLTLNVLTIILKKIILCTWWCVVVGSTWAFITLDFGPRLFAGVEWGWEERWRLWPSITCWNRPSIFGLYNLVDLQCGGGKDGGVYSLDYLLESLMFITLCIVYISVVDRTMAFIALDCLLEQAAKQKFHIPLAYAYYRYWCIPWYTFYTILSTRWKLV